MNFEDELRAALERREPPAGFAGRVAARIARQRLQHRVYRFGAWAAAAAVVMGCGFEYYRYREAQRAREQALEALRIAGQQVVAARNRLERMGVLRPRVENQ